jgi:hypothetical protein
LTLGNGALCEVDKAFRYLEVEKSNKGSPCGERDVTLVGWQTDLVDLWGDELSHLLKA